MRFHPKRLLYIALIILIMLVYSFLLLRGYLEAVSIPRYEQESEFISNKDSLAARLKGEMVLEVPLKLRSYYDVWQVHLPEDKDTWDYSKLPEPHLEKMPRLLHQIFSDENIPHAYAPYVTNCRRVNSHFQYVLWTDRDCDRFMREQYPKQYKEFFNYYVEDLSRNDAVRYFILYHYGGVYLDMDMDCLKPLDSNGLLDSVTCLLDSERTEQTRLVHGRNHSAMNSAMACHPKHPFLRFLIANLKSNMNNDLMNAAGPHFLTDHLITYRSAQRRQNIQKWRSQHHFGTEQQLARLMPMKDNSPSRLSSQGSQVTVVSLMTLLLGVDAHRGYASEAVFVASAEVFSPFMDLVNINNCKKYWKRYSQNSLRYQGCADWHRVDFSRGSPHPQYSICAHHFLHLGHTYWRELAGGLGKTIPVTQLGQSAPLRYIHNPRLLIP